MCGEGCPLGLLTDYTQSLGSLTVPPGVTETVSLSTPVSGDVGSSFAVSWGLFHGDQLVDTNDLGAKFTTITIIGPSASTSSAPNPPAPTATAPTSLLGDGVTFAGESGFPTLDPGEQTAISFTLENTGSTTWSDPGGYALVCTSTCLGGANTGIGAAVTPGQSHTFSITITAPYPTNQQHTVYRTWWSLARNGQTIGPLLYIDVTVHGFQDWFAQQRPYCDNGSPWQSVGTPTLDCSSGNGLVMSQYGNEYAEVDLDTPNGTQNYNQTLFRWGAQAALLNPGDTSVWATLIVQTPQDANQYGGFMLAVNSQGAWRLQQILSATNIPTVGGGQVALNPGQFTLQLRVENGTLYALINGQKVAQLLESLNPQPGAVGLLEESDHPTSSAILWSNVDLQDWT